MDKILITPKEAGRLLSISENKIRDLCANDPTFPCVKNGTYYKVFTQGLIKWVEEKCDNKEIL